MFHFTPPVDSIDRVRALVAVMYPLLIAHHFLAGINKGYALRSEHRRLRQLVQPGQFFGSNTGKAGFQPVHQTHIIVTRHIADHLRGLFRPRSFTVIHLSVVDLRMLDSADNTEFNAFFPSRQSGKECSLMIIVERAAQCVAHLVGERGNTRHLISIGLHCQ